MLLKLRDIASYTDIIEKAKKYLKAGQKGPEGVKLHKGPRGGTYYNTEELHASRGTEPKKRLPAFRKQEDGSVMHRTKEGEHGPGTYKIHEKDGEHHLTFVSPEGTEQQLGKHADVRELKQLVAGFKGGEKNEAPKEEHVGKPGKRPKKPMSFDDHPGDITSDWINVKFAHLREPFKPEDWSKIQDWMRGINDDMHEYNATGKSIDYETHRKKFRDILSGINHSQIKLRESESKPESKPLSEKTSEKRGEKKEPVKEDIHPADSSPLFNEASDKALFREGYDEGVKHEGDPEETLQQLSNDDSFYGVSDWRHGFRAAMRQKIPDEDEDILAKPERKTKQPGFTTKLGKRYTVNSGNQFQRVEVTDPDTNETSVYDVKMREGTRGKQLFTPSEAKQEAIRLATERKEKGSDAIVQGVSDNIHELITKPSAPLSSGDKRHDPEQKKIATGLGTTEKKKAKETVKEFGVDTRQKIKEIAEKKTRQDRLSQNRLDTKN